METLTKAMRDSLKTIWRQNSSDSIKGATLNGLKKRGLVDGEGELTHEGFVAAVGLLPLQEQCESLGFDLITVEADYQGRPEEKVLAEFVRNDYLGTSNEGLPIHTLLKASVLDVLASLNTMRDREDACTRYLEAQLTILKDNHDQIIESARKTTESIFIRNVEELLTHTSIRNDVPSLTLDFAENFYRAIGVDGIARLLSFMASNPYVHRAGWPDLALIRSGKLEFVEVKTTDKFHSSQIDVMPKLREVLGSNIEVYRLRRPR